MSIGKLRATLTPLKALGVAVLYLRQGLPGTKLLRELSELAIEHGLRPPKVVSSVSVERAMALT